MINKIEKDMRYLQLLSQSFPTIADASTEIINLQAILHLPKDELKPVLAQMSRAVKLGGYIYTSFKYGDFEGDRHGRYFTHFTEESFGEYIHHMNELGIIEAWTTLDVRPGRGDERWLNIILQKSITT